jgi:hypothetical protein
MRCFEWEVWQILYRKIRMFGGAKRLIVRLILWKGGSDFTINGASWFLGLIWSWLICASHLLRIKGQYGARGKNQSSLNLIRSNRRLLRWLVLIIKIANWELKEKLLWLFSFLNVTKIRLSSIEKIRHQQIRCYLSYVS